MADGRVGRDALESRHALTIAPRHDVQAVLNALFAGLSEGLWATLWATEGDRQEPTGATQQRNPCKSEWARLGLNQRPLACEAISR